VKVVRFDFSEFRYRCLIYAILGVVWTVLGAMWHLYGYAGFYPEHYPWWVYLGNLLAIGGLIALLSIPGGRTPVSGSLITVPIGVLVNFIILSFIGEIVWGFKSRRMG